MFQDCFNAQVSEKISAAIFAGGGSRRMGSDKAELMRGGETLLARLARLASEAGLPVQIVGRARPDGWPVLETDFVPDEAPGRGPLGALATALRRANGPVLALPCDLPLLTGDALRWLLSQETGLWGVAVWNGGQLEPLFSIYAPACLPEIERRLAQNRLSLHGLIESAGAGGFARAHAPDWLAAQLVNVNTPEEWAWVIGPSTPGTIKP